MPSHAHAVRGAGQEAGGGGSVIYTYTYTDWVNSLLTTGATDNNYIA